MKLQREREKMGDQDAAGEWERQRKCNKKGLFITLNISTTVKSVRRDAIKSTVMHVLYGFLCAWSFINARLFTWWVLLNHDINFHKRTTEYNLIFLKIWCVRAYYYYNCFTHDGNICAKILGRILFSTGKGSAEQRKSVENSPQCNKNFAEYMTLAKYRIFFFQYLKTTWGRKCLEWSLEMMFSSNVFFLLNVKWARILASSPNGNGWIQQQQQHGICCWLQCTLWANLMLSFCRDLQWQNVKRKKCRPKGFGWKQNNKKHFKLNEH